jgi:flavin reductase (DIM6/NTAB) family NADH-FMN oxidoreductase RutF
MATGAKRNFSVSKIRRFLELGPIVLVSSAWKGKINIMTMGWHMVDSSLINKYSLFVLEVVKAHVASSPKFPQTVHYRGHGLFMISGPTVKRYRKGFKPQNL